MEERRKAIIDLINEKGFVSFAELKSHFPQVSDMTLRRDLEYLDRIKQIIRIHGGAKSLDIVIGTEDFMANRSVRNIEEKKLIASKAITLLKPGSAVFVDSGSTMTLLSQVFPDGNYKIFTSGISCALELSRLAQAQVHILGGQLNAPSLSVNGSRSLDFLENVNFSLAFFGVTGYSTTKGFTCGEEEEYKLKSTVIRKSDQVSMLMDSSKVGKVSTFTFAAMKDVNYIISDGRLDASIIKLAEQYGVDIL